MAKSRKKIMPNPLSKVRPGLVRMRFDPDVLLARPELAAHISTILNIWAHCDHACIEILTQFLKADFRAVHKMQEALVGSETRRAILYAAAKNALSDDDFNLFDKTMAAVLPYRKIRNDFAHHIWGCSKDVKNALLLINPIDYAEIVVGIADFAAGGTNVMPQLDRNKILVYKARELNYQVSKATQCLSVLGCLASCLSRYPEVRGQGRRSLVQALQALQGPQPTKTQRSR